MDETAIELPGDHESMTQHVASMGFLLRRRKLNDLGVVSEYKMEAVRLQY